MINNNKTVTISIVTPLYNNETFFSETIESVVFQKGNFFIEYIIIDNCSTDNSLNIAYKYQKLLIDNSWLIKCNGVKFHIVSEPDKGMYDAVNKGFSYATGDIFAYINSDDIYLPGAFEIIAQTFNNYPQVKWLKGITSYINDKSIIYKRGSCNLYYHEWIKQGVYGTLLYFIQQDSVFWKAELWNKVGGINNTLKLAGDFSLWIDFSSYAKLYSVNIQVSCFRKTDNQLSADISKYYDEITTIKYDKVSISEKIKIKIYYYLHRRIRIEFFLKILYKILFLSHEYNYIKINLDNSCLLNQKYLMINETDREGK